MSQPEKENPEHDLDTLAYLDGLNLFVHLTGKNMFHTAPTVSRALTLANLGSCGLTYDALSCFLIQPWSDDATAYPTQFWTNDATAYYMHACGNEGAGYWIQSFDDQGTAQPRYSSIMVDNFGPYQTRAGGNIEVRHATTQTKPLEGLTVRSELSNLRTTCARVSCRAMGLATRELILRRSGSGTAPEANPPWVEEHVRTLFGEAVDERFDDGVESSFARELVSVVERWGDSAMAAAAWLVIRDLAEPQVSREALRALGHMRHADSHSYRLWLLERSLHALSPWVRDGAALGLASMRDVHAIAHLTQAVERESLAELREESKASHGGFETSPTWRFF